MLFTAEHEEPRRSLQKFIAAEINPHVDSGRRLVSFRRTRCSRSSETAASSD
jgi:hypothetical protein